MSLTITFDSIKLATHRQTKHFLPVLLFLMAATASIITPSPLLSLLLLLLLVNQFQLSIASHPDPCSSTRFRNTCSNVFQLNLSAINVTDDRVSFSISSSSLTLLNITYTVNSSSGGCSTGSGECRNDSYQYYSNGASSSQEQELTNVYHIFCNVKQNELVSMKLDFGNCSYTFGLPQDRRGEILCYKWTLCVTFLVDCIHIG